MKAIGITIYFIGILIMLVAIAFTLSMLHDEGLKFDTIGRGAFMIYFGVLIKDFGSDLWDGN